MLLIYFAFASLLAALLPLAVSTWAIVGTSTPDDRVLPTSAPTRQVGNEPRAGFASDASSTLIAVGTGHAPSSAEAAYAQRLSLQAGVTSMEVPTGTYVGGRQVSGVGGSAYQNGEVSYWQIQNHLASSSAPAQDLVHQVRALAPPKGLTIHVGGTTADIVGQEHSIDSSLPIAIAIMVVASFLMLFLFTGSVLIPLKAMILNALTLFAVLGLMVWIFQQGHLSGLLGFTPTPISTTVPPLLFVIAFAMSMDYELFVMSRIKELHDRGTTNTEAVVGGLARTGRIVSTATAIMLVTFFAFGLSKISFIQFFGIGSGVVILVDATIVRGVLVPALMRLVGERIWRAPRPLRRFHHRYGPHETPDLALLASTEPGSS